MTAATGQNLPHDSARGHVSGESVYIDDIPPLRGELVVDFFYSPVAHGRILSLDLEEAARVPGIVGLYDWRDLHHNLFGAIYKDEILLVEDVCTFRGQPIVVIAAENAAAARAAKRAMKIELEELKPILTIDEAIAASSFLYIAVADLIPGLHRRVDPASSVKQFVFIVLGVAVIYVSHRIAH